MGDVKEEEEPEGEVVAVPSREVIVHSSGNMLPHFSCSHYYYSIYFLLTIPLQD